MRRKISTIQIQCENPKTIIDEELKKLDANLGDNYDDFIEYCKNRGLFGNDTPYRSIGFFSRENIRKLYKEFRNPVKQVSALLGLTYKELGKQIGYTGMALTNAVVRGELSVPMQKALELFLKNYDLKKDIEKQKIVFNLAIKAMSS